ncbi:lymphocyte function-associated antigen 3-like [Huso huso]|uniref:Lymphocyte function-associated antigen 3-like n=1 Tax=Huso huso TaxID=61971 RepID=A0ABR0ZLW2_HUSHU
MLLAQHITDAVSVELVYSLLNEDVVLTPQFNGELQEVLWRYRKDKIAEYTSSPESLEYFSRFKGRTELNTADGSLTIKRVTFEDRGIYYAELQVDGRTQTHTFNIEVIRHVSKPTVTCNVTGSIVTLHCMGDNNTENSYKWEGQNHHGKELQTSLKENDDSKYVCVTSNKKSEQRSDPFAVTDCKKAGDSYTLLVGILVTVATVVVVLGAVAGFVYCRIHKKGEQNEGGNNESDPELLGVQEKIKRYNALAGETKKIKNYSESKPANRKAKKDDDTDQKISAPFINSNKLDSEDKPAPVTGTHKKNIANSENKPAPRGEAALSPAPQGEAPLGNKPAGN